MFITWLSSVSNSISNISSISLDRRTWSGLLIVRAGGWTTDAGDWAGMLGDVCGQSMIGFVWV